MDFNFASYGIGGLIILACDIYALLNVAGSSATIGKKVVWILVILVLPILGFIGWWLAGPRSSHL